MLYVTTKDREHIYHLGNKFCVLPRTVIEIQADCTELEWILSQFKNLPHTSAAVQSWHGDQAKQIAAALWRIY